MCLIVFSVKKWRKIKEANTPNEIKVDDTEII
jgi:hypothetical protein